MNMVVDVLASNDWCNGVGLFLLHTTGTLKLSSLLLKTSLYSVGIAVDVVTLLNGENIGVVLLR